MPTEFADLIAAGQIYNGLSAVPFAHTATPITYNDDGVAEWIEGEPTAGGLAPTNGKAFPCVLFIPRSSGAAADQYRLREVRVPTMLFNPLRPDGSVVDLSHEDELMIDAPELTPWTGANPARWLVDGMPQPFGPPGTVLGVLATLRQVVG